MGLKDLFRMTPLSPSSLDGEDPFDWAGPDDLWPSENAEVRKLRVADPPEVAPEVITTEQYGLQMPNGDIIWNAYSDAGVTIPFDNHLDRLRMIATLKKTAADVGFDVDDFLSHYSWVSRNQIAAVVYEDTGSYSLTDSEVCGVSESVRIPDGEA